MQRKLFIRFTALYGSIKRGQIKREKIQIIITECVCQ